MKNRFMVAVLLSCVSLFGCDDDTPKESVPQQSYSQSPVVVNNPAPVIVQSQDNGLSSFIAGAVVGNVLSGSNNNQNRIVEHHYYDQRGNPNTNTRNTTKYYSTNNTQKVSTQKPKKSTYTPFSRSSSSKSYSRRK